MVKISSLHESKDFFNYLNMSINPCAPTRLLYYSKEPVPLFVFEDVSLAGYKTPEKPLDFEETKFVTSKLAKFHAASMCTDSDVSIFIKRLVHE